MSAAALLILGAIIGATAHALVRRAPEPVPAANRYHLNSLSGLPDIIVFEAAAQYPGQPLDEIPYTISRGGLLETIGLEQGEWEGTPFLPTVPAPHRAPVAAVLAGDAPEYEYRTPYPTADGGTLHMHVVALRYTDGHLVGHVRDVTEAVEREAEIERQASRLATYGRLFDDDLDNLITRARG